MPLGARLAPVHDAAYRIVRFGAQEYIADPRHSQGYQGYAGPQWVGHVLLPLRTRVRPRGADLLRGLPAGVLQSVMSQHRAVSAMLCAAFRCRRKRSSAT